VKRLLLVLLLLGLFLGLVSIAASSAEKVLIYAALDSPTLEAIAEEFTKSTGIGVEWVRGGAGEMAVRIRAEKSRPQADVFIGGSVDVHGDLAKDGLLAKISPENAKALAPQYKDPEGRYFGWYLGLLGLVLNTDMLKEEMEGVMPPKTWDDLLEPEWQGKVVSSSPATSGGAYIFIATQIFRFEQLAPYFGFKGDAIRKEAEKAAWDWFLDFNKNIDLYTAKATEPITLTAQGQYVVGMSWAHDILVSVEKGLPVVLIVPPYTGFEIGGVSAIEGAPHPEIAEKFVNFVLSEKSQEINATVGAKRYPTLPGVVSPPNSPDVKDVVLVKYDRAWAIENRSRLLDKWEEVIAK